MMYKFAPASENETIVFGSARPGYSNEQVSEWIEFMHNQGIQRVCCLLPESQLRRYSNLLDFYRQSFGLDRVCWTPIEDFHLADPEILIQQILPFLAAANQNHQKVVVHCSGGVGRTGHILAAWLVAGRGLSGKAAIAAVKQTGKNPSEAVIAALFNGRNPWRVSAELNSLLDQCSHFRNPQTQGFTALNKAE
ncbi:protein-tyrosine phosphatase family protein [[Phormidium ambiguum] IAM M-71]|nr:dual specificity protein phosphatase family protein [Phormidium ambiguum]